MQKTQLIKFWDLIRASCPYYWKEEKLQNIAFDEFVEYFEDFDFNEFKETIKYVKRHLIKNGLDWPGNEKIKNTHKMLLMEKRREINEISEEKTRIEIEEQERKEAHEWWIANGKPSVSEQIELVQKSLRKLYIINAE